MRDLVAAPKFGIWEPGPKSVAFCPGKSVFAFCSPTSVHGASGVFAKGPDGRIDGPKGGWKGKGLWSTYATRAPFHVEGGKGTTSKVLHFQLRPDPLAR